MSKILNEQLMQEDDGKTLYKLVGAIQALKMSGNFIDAARYSLYKQIRDSKAYKLMGFDWKGFCRDELGRDQEVVNAEIKMLEEFGEPFIRAAQQIKLTKRELTALGSGLSEDAKAEVKRGVIKIGDTEFKIEELSDNIDEFKTTVELLVKQKELEQKEKKHLEKKLGGLEKEYKKELQAYKNELEFLKAKLADPKLPEGFNEFIMAVERYTDEIVTIASKLHFDETFGGAEDEGPVKALYMKRLETVLNCFNHCINVLENAIGAKLPGRM